MNVPIITIDGPVASGKGTVARAVAEALGFHLLDSGAIYRAHALACLNRGIKSNEIKTLVEIAQALSLKFSGDRIALDGHDVTTAVRAEAVGMMASTLSAIPEVRAALFDRQRAFAQPPGLVADGRDMGTVVFPEASLKLYLTASAPVRAARRAGQVATAPPLRDQPAKQLIDKGIHANIHGSPEAVDVELVRAIEAQIRQRDVQDKSRPIAPLRPAPEALVIDNAAQRPSQTVAAVLALWRLRLASPSYRLQG